MRSILLSTILLGACATGSLATDRETSPRLGVKLEITPAAEAGHVFPSTVDARLPSAGRLDRQILTELGRTASVEVELCVAPAGAVRSVAIARGSSLAAFDQAVLADARAWRFARLPGPATVQSCTHATVTYYPHT